MCGNGYVEISETLSIVHSSHITRKREGVIGYIVQYWLVVHDIGNSTTNVDISL